MEGAGVGPLGGMWGCCSGKETTAQRSKKAMLVNGTRDEAALTIEECLEESFAGHVVMVEKDALRKIGKSAKSMKNRKADVRSRGKRVARVIEGRRIRFDYPCGLKLDAIKDISPRKEGMQKILGLM